MPGIHDNEVYLISGATVENTGILNVRGFNNLNFQYWGLTTGTIPASGDLVLAGRVLNDSPFVPFFSAQIRGSTGNFVSYSNVTWNSVIAIISPISGGLINVAVRSQS